MATNNAFSSALNARFQTPAQGGYGQPQAMSYGSFSAPQQRSPAQVALAGFGQQAQQPYGQPFNPYGMQQSYAQFAAPQQQRQPMQFSAPPPVQPQQFNNSYGAMSAYQQAQPPQQMNPYGAQTANQAQMQRQMQQPQMSGLQSYAQMMQHQQPQPIAPRAPQQMFNPYLPNPQQFGAGMGGFSPFQPTATPNMQLPYIGQFNYRQNLPQWQAPQIQQQRTAQQTLLENLRRAPQPTPNTGAQPSYNFPPPINTRPGFGNLPSYGGATPPPPSAGMEDPNPWTHQPDVGPGFDTLPTPDATVGIPKQDIVPGLTNPDGSGSAAWYQGPTEPGMYYTLGAMTRPGFAKGGRVKRKYAGGGLVDMMQGYGLVPDYVTLDDNELLGGAPANFTDSEPAALNTPVAAELPAATAPVAPPPAMPTAPLPVAPARPDLSTLYSRYLNPANPYAAELKSAREAAGKETEAFNQLIERAIASGGEDKPSKEELYFRLAAAFAKPTRTGHFSEALGEASGVMAEQAAAERKVAREGRAEKLQLGIAAQKAKMEAAKSDLTNLRTLAGEEMKDQRALATKALEQYIASGKPQSEAGKAAADMGLSPGTPEYQKYVNQYIQGKLESGNLFKEAMVQIAAGNLGVAQAREGRAVAKEKREAATLTPAEIKIRDEAEEQVASLTSAFDALSRAYELNPNTFTGAGPDIVQRRALELSGAPSEKLTNTRVMENLLGGQALEQLKTIFGSAPTEGERAILMDLQGVGAKSTQERAEIIKRAAQLVQQRRARAQRKLDEVRAGRYKSVQPTTEEGAE